MFKEQKYYGEIWLPNKEEAKCFCVLEFKDGEIYLETNLSNNLSGYKIELIYGVFNSMGYASMVNNVVKQSTSGIMQAKIYNPEYFFCSPQHIIEPKYLKMKEFKIDNSAFNDWIRQFKIYDFIDNKIEQKDLNHKILLTEESIELEIIKTTNYNSNQDRLMLINRGFVLFKSNKKLNILDSIELYNRFQKFLLFYFGKSNHFESFNFRCLGCNEWVSLYFKDTLIKEKSSNFIRLEYKDLKDDLDKLLNHWYSDDDIQFCVDIIIENLLSQKVSHSRRFTNSLSAYEAYNKRFGRNHKKPTLERYLHDSKDIIIEISEMNDSLYGNFTQKIIRSRDFFVHGNKNQRDCFTKFELLYISFLLDFVVGIELSKQMDLSLSNIQKMINSAKSNFIDMQSVNKILNQNVFNC